MLLYTRELVVPRPSRFPGGLLRFGPNQSSKLNCRDRLCSSFAQISVHGMQNVFRERHLWQRALWLAIVLGAGIVGFILYSQLRARLSDQILVSLIETTQLPVYHTAFPAVAVCPWSHVNWQRAHSAMLRFLPPNPDAELQETFRLFLLTLEVTSFSNFRRASSLRDRNMSRLRALPMMRMINYLAYRCDEIFVNNSCYFDETPYNCCSLFVPEQTEKGQCLVFNSLISSHSQKKQLTNKFYPYKLSTAGEESGLKFTLNVTYEFAKDGAHYPFGMNLMIKQPRQWSNQMMYHLYPDTENFVSVRPTFRETSENTKDMSPRKRNCYFDNEKNPYFKDTYLPYNRDNCLAVCLHQVVLKACNCSTPVFLPPIEGIRECEIVDAGCLGDNSDIFSYSKTGDEDKYINDPRRGHYCYCPENCNSLQYQMSLNVRKIDYPKNSTEKQIKVQVYFGQRVMTKIITKLKYTDLDLLANFGGIVSLYIGASAMSFVELFLVSGKVLWSLAQGACRKFKEYRK